MAGDEDIATEVGLKGGLDREGDTLDGDAFGQVKVRDFLCTALREGGGLGGHGEERLGFAAGGDGGSANHLRPGSK